MSVPLLEYQGGGAAATLEPLSEHLEAYGAQLAQNFAGGVQACYRGTRLCDTGETKKVVKKWVDFYKKYRDILDSDIIHLRRPGSRDIDGILHVNASLKTRSLAVLYNPAIKLLKKRLDCRSIIQALKTSPRFASGLALTKSSHLHPLT